MITRTIGKFQRKNKFALFTIYTRIAQSRASRGTTWKKSRQSSDSCQQWNDKGVLFWRSIGDLHEFGRLVGLNKA